MESEQTAYRDRGPLFLLQSNYLLPYEEKQHTMGLDQSISLWTVYDPNAK